MKQEDKELLLRDLCARLPYGVMCYGVTMNTYEDDNYIRKEVTGTLCEIHKYKSKCCYGLVGLMNECNIETIKPYLRPMSSMTKDELKEFMTTCEALEHRPDVTVPTTESYDWLNEHHFDYRKIKNEKGDRKTMIDLGLALPAPEGMYNF